MKELLLILPWRSCRINLKSYKDLRKSRIKNCIKTYKSRIKKIFVGASYLILSEGSIYWSFYWYITYANLPQSNHLAVYFGRFAVTSKSTSQCVTGQFVINNELGTLVNIFLQLLLFIILHFTRTSFSPFFVHVSREDEGGVFCSLIVLTWYLILRVMKPYWRIGAVKFNSKETIERNCVVAVYASSTCITAK